MKCANFLCRGHNIKYKKYGNCSKASVQDSFKKTAPNLYWDIDQCETRKRYNRIASATIKGMYPHEIIGGQFRIERDKYYGRK